MAIEKRKEKEPCKHPHVYKEYMFGLQTGDQVCMSCGQVIYTEKDWAAFSKGNGPQLHDLP